jgi:hypothetical protein
VTSHSIEIDLSQKISLSCCCECASQSS